MYFPFRDLNRNGASMKTLLVVDEDRENLAYIRDLLRDSGYSGVFAESLEEARSLAAADPGLELALVAIPAPPLTAEEAARRLAGFRAGLRIVFMSSHPAQLLARNGIAVPDTLLEKPFTRVRLLEALDAIAEGPASAPASEASATLEEAA
jgi:CheY-like chemotaxis protein